MRANIRLLAAGVVGAAAIVACISSLTLSETEQRSMSFPSSVSAGNVMIGQTGMTPEIIFAPATAFDNDMIMSITENCGNWTLNLNPLPADVYCDTIAMDTGGSGAGSCVPHTYSFTATFAPTGPGASSCPVTVAYSSNNSGSGSGTGGTGNIQTVIITLNGTGVAPAYALSMSPPNNSTLQYTDIPIGSVSSPQKISITNVGTDSLTVTGTHTNMVAFPLNPLMGASFVSQTLAMGQSASYEVSCAPTAAQSYTGTITFRTSQAQGSLTRTVNLNCNGITSDLVIVPNPASFPRNTLVGQPQDLEIEITNNGAQTTFTDVHLMTGGEVTITQPPMSPLANLATTTITLHYTAETEREFGRIDNLVITHTPGGTRTVAINAEALVGEIGVTPALVDFGPVCPGSEKTADLMVYATGSGPVNLMSITQPTAPFSVLGSGGSLEPNHGNIISLTAKVTAQAAGVLDDSFTLNTNLPGAGATHDVQLQGVALPAGVTPTPNLVHFGPGRIGSPTTAKKITISNCGGSPLEITGARIEGPSASEFAIVGPEDPLQTIPTMGELEFLVIMTPSATGTKLAKLVVEYAGGVAEADLDGNGFGVDTEGGEEKTTYYTCSAGGVGGLPIALAVLFMRRRRRR